MRLETRGERIFHGVNYFLFVLMGILCIYPFIYIISESLSSTRAVTSGEVVLLPVECNVHAYAQVFQDGQLFTSMVNTVVITVVGTVLNMVCTILCAYSLSKKRLVGRSVFLVIISITMVIGAGMIPHFILVKTLGLMNSDWALWLPGLVSTFNMIIIKTYFESLPASLSEAAEIDGANELVTLISIIIPVSMPVIATIALFYAVGWWNSYFSALMYLTSPAKYPLMVQLMNMIQQAQMQTQTDVGSDAESIIIAPQTMQAASIVIATIPIMCIYPFLQKYFVKGVMVGSIKG